MKKILTLLTIVGGAYYASANLDPLPTIQPGPVESMYEYREKDIVIHAVDTEPESTLHCIFEGRGCRFTVHPQD